MNVKTVKNFFLFILSGFFIGSGMIVLFYTLTPLPKIETTNIASKQSIVLEDREGRFLFDFSNNEKRTHTPYEEISENIVNATIAIEDHLFFEHGGVRFDAFLRAALYNVLTGSFSQGGSTITQQVVKNVFLTKEKKIERKIKEFLLAIKLEGDLEKKEILELYLNTIPYGGVVYGVGEASNSFFGKKPSEVTIAEAAYLAAIPNAPTFFSPYGSNKAALEKRKNAVLELMFRHNLISREEYTKARQEGVHFKEQNSFKINAPHFVFFVKEDLEKEYGVSLKELEGKKIRTSVDLELQEKTEENIKEFSEDFEKKYKGKNLASVILDRKTGEILTMVGSRDFFDNEIDGSVNITTSLRQPGSTFKPIAYAKAFEKGLEPETIIYDVPTQFTYRCEKEKFETTEDGCYSPVNYSGKFEGPIPLRSALARSKNIPAVKILYLAGVNDVVKLGRQMGITSLSENPYYYGLSLVLGGAEVSPLEMAQAYNVFANEGIFIPYTWEVVKENREGKRVLEENAALKVIDILSDNAARAPTFGINSPLNIQNQQVAVKTGTTNNIRDVWVIGFSPDVVVVVWGGNSDGTLLENEASGASLGILFRKIMLSALKKYGRDGIYFPKNIQPNRSGVVMVNGNIEEELHSILHYVNRVNFNKQTRDDERDQQYDHWEEAVQIWVEENEGRGIIENISNKLNFVQGFNIKKPSKTRILKKEELITIETTFLPFKNIRYEFYINEKLIRSSLDGSITFKLSENFTKEREVVIRVIAHSEEGVYSAEQVYKVQ